MILSLSRSGYVSVAAGLGLTLLGCDFLSVRHATQRSVAMEPTIKNGDRVAYLPFDDSSKHVNRGDVVLFISAQEKLRTGREYVFFKRVIGLGGETVELRDRVLYVDNHRVDEPYARYDPRGEPDWFGRSFEPVLVPPEHVFLMGDNRDQSADSRMFGPVPESLLVGRWLPGK